MLIFFYKTASYIERILISKLFKSTSGDNLPSWKKGKMLPDVDLNSFEIRIDMGYKLCLQYRNRMTWND